MTNTGTPPFLEQLPSRDFWERDLLQASYKRRMALQSDRVALLGLHVDAREIGKRGAGRIVFAARHAIVIAVPAQYRGVLAGPRRAALG